MTQNKSGFAMLFTVLIVTLILSIAVSISNTTFKQGVLSNLAKDSQVAFFEADSAVECGLYYDITVTPPPFILGTDTATAPTNIDCGDKRLYLDTSVDMIDYHTYRQDGADPLKPCFSVIFDKATTIGTNRIIGKGYNQCGASPRQVERSLETRY